MDINQHKASFDAKMCYTTTCFVVPPTLATRLPIPGGWNNVDGMQYAMSPDPIGGGRDYFIINKTESNQGESLLDVFESKNTQTIPKCLYAVADGLTSA